MCSYERWYELYHTPRQKQFIESQKIKKEREELIKLREETNSLLAQVKGKKQAEPAAAK